METTRPDPPRFPVDNVDAGQAIAERLAGIEIELGALRALLETVFRLVVSAASISPKMRRGLESAMIAGGLDPTRWLP